MFAVSMERPLSQKQFRYASADAAEKVARRVTSMRGGEISIWKFGNSRSSYSHEEVAIVLKDANERIWTQVLAMPGEEALL